MLGHKGFLLHFPTQMKEKSQVSTAENHRKETKDKKKSNFAPQLDDYDIEKRTEIYKITAQKERTR